MPCTLWGGRGRKIANCLCQVGKKGEKHQRGPDWTLSGKGRRGGKSTCAVKRGKGEEQLRRDALAWGRERGNARGKKKKKGGRRTINGNFRRKKKRKRREKRGMRHKVKGEMTLSHC